jgi:hypothetical protein
VLATFPVLVWASDEIYRAARRGSGRRSRATATEDS